jgi:membrane-associated protease RseP (regulator of RpoE activity)
MEENKAKLKQRAIFFGLLIVTVVTTTISGAEWMTGKPLMYYTPALTFPEVLSGMLFSIPFLGILTFHEFGHYLTAHYYKIKVTLPRYIPFWLGFVFMPFTIGTLGAFIRILEPVRSRKQYFDIGIAGPLAGFVVALIVMIFAFTHLPAREHIFSIHPEYMQYGMNYAEHVYKEPGMLKLGDNLIFWFFRNYVAADPSMVPNSFELYHYPLLFAAFLALFFTSMNLLPLGQLDGGHVIYGLFGFKNHSYISIILFFIFLYFAGLGIVTPYDPVKDMMITLPLYAGFLFICLYSLRVKLLNRILIAVSILAAQFVTSTLFPHVRGYEGWLAFGFIIGRFLGLYHPPVEDDQPLSTGRKILGWITLIIFIISFSPRPFDFT